MKKTIIAKKITCFILAIITLIALLPTTAMAAGDDIAAEIRGIYATALRKAGLPNFLNFCGAMAGRFLEATGVTSHFVGFDGKYAYDTFKDQSVSSGGYDITAYPASSYTLKQALNTISNNGRTDVGNILVGFEKGSDNYMGNTYGHAVYIFRIAGGHVWFMENFGLYVAGEYHPQETPVSCTIDEFCALYASCTQQLDGVIWFRNYLNECTYYPSYAKNVAITKNGTVYVKSQPCSRSTYSRSEDLGKVYRNDRLPVLGLYRNTQGNVFYAIRLANGTVGYIFAGDARVTDPTYSIDGYDSVDGRSVVQGYRYVN